MDNGTEARIKKVLEEVIDRKPSRKLFLTTAFISMTAVSIITSSLLAVSVVENRQLKAELNQVTYEPAESLLIQPVFSPYEILKPDLSNCEYIVQLEGRQSCSISI